MEMFFILPVSKPSKFRPLLNKAGSEGMASRVMRREIFNLRLPGSRVESTKQIAGINCVSKKDEVAIGK
jgi:hypothetical protein